MIIKSNNAKEEIEMEDFIAYLTNKIEEEKAEAEALQADGRKDDANFTKVRINIYDVCRTVSKALMNRPDGGTAIIGERFERFREEWGAALEKAKQFDDIDRIAVEENKLAALEDVIAHYQEVTVK